jgi:CHAT domain-containing protein
LLMGSVHAKLGSLGLQQGNPVLLLPQGGLGALPLHAAWRMVDGSRRYFLDDYIVTYVPSGQSMSIARKRLNDAHGLRRSLLAVINPTNDLPFAAAEGDALQALFAPDCRRLEGTNATSEKIAAGVTGSVYLHFSCHGFYAWREPMRSGFLVANGEHLTSADVIARFDLSDARLATLSACETGLTDTRQAPDEYLGLPAGFLRAGAQAVVSTLWSVNDLSTMLLMERFYRYHLEDELAPNVALCRAQRWLRDTTRGELRETFGRYRSADSDRPRLPSDMAEKWFAHYALGDPTNRPFEHPYYWAAFVVSGI